MIQSVDETRQLIERYAAAWLGGDRAGAVACYHEGFTLHYFGRNALSGDHVGKQAALQTLGEVARRTSWRVTAIKCTFAEADRAVIVARVAYGPADARVERDRVLLFAVSDGLLRECWAYDEDQALMDRLTGSG